MTFQLFTERSGHIRHPGASTHKTVLPSEREEDPEAIPEEEVTHLFCPCHCIILSCLSFDPLCPIGSIITPQDCALNGNDSLWFWIRCAVASPTLSLAKKRKWCWLSCSSLSAPYCPRLTSNKTFQFAAEALESNIMKFDAKLCCSLLFFAFWNQILPLEGFPVERVVLKRPTSLSGQTNLFVSAWSFTDK